MLCGFQSHLKGSRTPRCPFDDAHYKNYCRSMKMARIFYLFADNTTAKYI
jgi:hypothetical protein